MSHDQSQSLRIGARNPAKRKEVFSCAVPQDQLAALHALAEEKDTSVSQLGREAISEFLRAHGKLPAKPANAGAPMPTSTPTPIPAEPLACPPVGTSPFTEDQGSCDQVAEVEDKGIDFEIA